MIFENIASLCSDKGISIARLERETGLGNGVVGKWKESSPRLETVKKVADYLETTIDDLLSTDKTNFN